MTTPLRLCRLCESALTAETQYPSDAALKRRICKACRNADSSRRQKANPSIGANAKRRYKERHAEEVARTRRAYHDRNRHVNGDRTGARRAKRQGAPFEHRDVERCRAIYERAIRISEITGRSFHVDHIAPLSRGGSHDHRNLIVMRADLNMAKGNEHWPWLHWFNDFDPSPEPWDVAPFDGDPT